eukprot:6184817-Pleurochrysis_carterae.AAC.2
MQLWCHSHEHSLLEFAFECDAVLQSVGLSFIPKVGHSPRPARCNMVKHIAYFVTKAQQSFDPPKSEHCS